MLRVFLQINLTFFIFFEFHCLFVDIFILFLSMEVFFKNPLEYFIQTPHIIENILNSLCIKDVLNIALVNSSYYKFVIESKFFKNRVKLKINRQLFKNNYEAIKNSDRNYRNIQINLNFNCDQKFFNLLEKFHNVKCLELSNGVLSTCEFCMLVEAFDTIQELILDDIEFEDLNLNEVKNLRNLSKLKNFKIQAIQEELVHPLLIQCHNLKRLSIKQLSRKAPFDELLKLLSNEVQFKLEEFEISDYGYYNFDQQKLGMVSFLEKSFETLKVLEFDVWIGILSLKLVFQMPHLKKLRLYEIAHADKAIVWEDIEIPQNHKLDYLNIQDYSHNEKLLTAILKAAAKIHILEVYSLNHDDIREISAHCSELRELHAYFLDINDDSIFQNNLLSHLNRCNVTVSDDLKQTIMSRNESERSHFEKLLLAN